MFGLRVEKKKKKITILNQLSFSVFAFTCRSSCAFINVCLMPIPIIFIHTYISIIFFLFCSFYLRLFVGCLLVVHSIESCSALISFSLALTLWHGHIFHSNCLSQFYCFIQLPPITDYEISLFFFVVLNRYKIHTLHFSKSECENLWQKFTPIKCVCASADEFFLS